MATHAPWGAGNDPPQALPGGIIISLDFYILFCQQIADSYDKFRLDSDLGLGGHFWWFLTVIFLSREGGGSTSRSRTPP